jgi:hypothetical protein
LDTAARQSSRSRQPSTRALQHLYKEADIELSDDEMDSDAGLDDDDKNVGDGELLDSQEEEGDNGSGDELETAVDSGGEARERAPIVPSKCARGPGKGAYLLLLMVTSY